MSPDEPLDGTADEADETTPITEQLTVDAGTPTGVKRQRRTQTTVKNESDAFWKAVFADPVGRREMWTLLNRLHPFTIRAGVGPNGAPDHDANVRFLAEQIIGLTIFLEWQARDLDGMNLMLREHDPRFAKKS